jgi:hypothetical protein
LLAFLKAGLGSNCSHSGRAIEAQFSSQAGQRPNAHTRATMSPRMGAPLPRSGAWRRQEKADMAAVGGLAFRRKLRHTDPLPVVPYGRRRLRDQSRSRPILEGARCNGGLRFFIIVNGRIESPAVAHTCATDGEAILMARQAGCRGVGRGARGGRDQFGCTRRSIVPTKTALARADSGATLRVGIHTSIHEPA